MITVSAPDEVWRDIPGYEGLYQASGFGRIRTVPRLVRSFRYRWQNSRVLKTTSYCGYPNVTLFVAGKRQVRAVHSLVCLAFHGPPPTAKHEVAHCDGSRTNACATNLRWATRSENQLDRLAHGTATKPWVIDEETARKIIARLNDGEAQKAIARSLGLNRWTVQSIWRGNSWKSLNHLLQKAA